MSVHPSLGRPAASPTPTRPSTRPPNGPVATHAPAPSTSIPTPRPPASPAPTNVPVSVPHLLDGRPTCLRGQLHMPFPSGRHPDTDAVGEEMLAWLAGLGLLDARTANIFARARFHELAGLVYHRSDRDVLRLAADFIAALFVLDDLVDGGAHSTGRDEHATRAAMAPLREAARTGVASEGGEPSLRPVAEALADLRRRLDARGGTVEGWLAELDVYLDGVVEESGRRARGYDSVEDYAAVRVAFSAVYACVELGLGCEGLRLTPALRRLARAANLSVSFVNDVYSWPKERAIGERSNLVAVLAEHRGLDERRAWAAACRACDEVVAGHLSARSGLGPGERRALPLLEAWMRGNYDWHAVGTERYTAALSVAPAS